MAAATDPGPIQRPACSRHRDALQQPTQRRAPRRSFRLCRLWVRPFLVDNQVRQRHGLAQFLPSPRQRHHRARRRVAGHVTHRGLVPPVRQPPRPCLRRWPQTDRPAFLHERCGSHLPPRLDASPADDWAGINGDQARRSTATIGLGALGYRDIHLVTRADHCAGELAGLLAADQNSGEIACLAIGQQLTREKAGLFAAKVHAGVSTRSGASRNRREGVSPWISSRHGGSGASVRCRFVHEQSRRKW